MRKAKSISRFLILVVVIYLATFASLYSLRFILNTQYPIVVVEGVSMQSTYFEGDLLLLKGIPIQNIHIGDVVVYQRTAGALLIVHRVVDIKIVNNTILDFIVQGDNRLTNQVPDAPVPAEDVMGTVIYHVPWLGRVVLALQSPVGLVLSGGLIVIILLLDVFTEEKKPKTGNPL